MEYDTAIVDPELVADLSSLPTPPQPRVTSSSPPLPAPAPRAAAPRAVRRLGIGEQKSAESSLPRSLERPPSPQAQNPPPLAAGQVPPRAEEELWYNSFTEDDSTSDGYTRPPRYRRRLSRRLLSSADQDLQKRERLFSQVLQRPPTLGFVNTRLYEGHCRDYFVAYTPRDLVWAKRMDYVLRRHNL
jgi:hypothetical protein